MSFWIEILQKYFYLPLFFNMIENFWDCESEVN